MVFVSADQKPSWFNNTAHTGTYAKKGQKTKSVWENFAKSRERYTILTVVNSNTDYDNTGVGQPPHVFILFKGKKNGRIISEVKELYDFPPWLHVQVQVCGSYREEDVIDALKIILPVARCTTESQVVLLDWFSAHRSDNVISFIESLGHVVLFHGGGCTPFTQINDTHLHALLARFLLSLENKVMHGKRKDMHLNFLRGIPTMSRADICDVVATAWKMVDHKEVARIGYLQTGPGLPGSGPIKHNMVYKDLRNVWNEIDPPVGMQEMGQRLRDDAYAFVQNGYPGKWSSWTHVKRLIVEHDNEDDPVPEGMEAFGYQYTFGDEDADESAESDEDNDGDGGVGEDDDMDGGGGGGGVVDVVDVDDEDDVPAVPGDDVSESVGHATDPGMTVAQAREILINDARHRNDDVLLRRLFDQRSETKKHEVEAATDVARVLQKRAFAEQCASKEKRDKSRKEAMQAKLDTELAAQRKAEALERTTQTRLTILQANAVLSQNDAARRQNRHQLKAEQKWLQTDYPPALVRKLRRFWGHKSDADKDAFSEKLKDLSKQNWFRYFPKLPAMWEPDKNILIKYADCRPLDGGVFRTVRCSGNFDTLMDEIAPPTHYDVKDAEKLLKTLLDKVAPGSSRYVFNGARGLLRMLHLNDYVVDKTFVCCIICLSKWLKQETFPQGIFDWPPLVPSSMIPQLQPQMAAASAASAGSDFPAMSSNGTM